MQRKTFADAECPIARSLERVGEWWSILIMRDALQGLRRFDEFSRSLDIAPNMLTRRLNAGGGGPARTPALQPAPAALSVRAHGQGRGFSRRAHGFRRLGQSPLRRGRAERAARRANKRAAGALVHGGSRRWPNGTAGAMHRAGRACRQRGNAPAPGGHAGAERATGSMNGLPGVRRLVEETDEAFAVLFLVAGHRSRSWLGKTRSSRLAHGAGRSASRAVRQHREPSAC